MARTARKSTTRKAMRKTSGRSAAVMLVEQGADRNCDWTPQPPDEKSRYPKFVVVRGGEYDANAPKGERDAIEVRITEGDPDCLTAQFCIYVQGASVQREFIESTVFAGQVREIHDALTVAIEQAEKLGIIPRRAPAKPELRVGPFEYIGERGAAGRWVGWEDRLRQRRGSHAKA